MESDRREEEIEEVNKEEIEEEPSANPNPRPVPTKVPEVEVQLYRSGKGPIDVFKSSLGGWDQDRLEVQDILEKYGFKSLFAFNPESGRGVPIRFSARNGRSILSYRDGSVTYVDGEPKRAGRPRAYIEGQVTACMTTSKLSQTPGSHLGQ